MMSRHVHHQLQDLSTRVPQTTGQLAEGLYNVGPADHVTDVFFNTVRDGVVTGEELASQLGQVTKEGGEAACNINNLNNLHA
ncbi:MAG TPA: hypothetical protein VF914_11255 [Chloroflexia bacterium]|jgi:hypothetical protein